MLELIQSAEFKTWHDGLRDKIAHTRISARIRLEANLLKQRDTHFVSFLDPPVTKQRDTHFTRRKTKKEQRDTHFVSSHFFSFLDPPVKQRDTTFPHFFYLTS